MATFITLTQDGTGDKVTVNADKIVYFARRPNLSFTTIFFENSQMSISVTETPDQIDRIVGNEQLRQQQRR